MFFAHTTHAKDSDLTLIQDTQRDTAVTICAETAYLVYFFYSLIRFISLHYGRRYIRFQCVYLTSHTADHTHNMSLKLMQHTHIFRCLHAEWTQMAHHWVILGKKNSIRFFLGVINTVCKSSCHFYK